MKEVKLEGRYTVKPEGCHFEDIPIFRKMADLGEQNDKDSSVNVCEVALGQYLPFKCKVLRWKMVKNKNRQLFLAYRTSTEKEEFPCIYRVIYDPYIKEVILKNVTWCHSKFQRLKVWYDNT